MDAKVMLVDDDKMILEAVELFFKSEGIRILTAASGQKCLDLLAEGFRGVILMDVMMPEMDGWDTIRKIVENDLYEGNIIIMLTALESPDKKMDGLQEYVTDYVTKPFNTTNLLSSLQYYLAILQTTEKSGTTVHINY